MSIHCGHCKSYHELVADVRACSQGMLVLPSQAREALGAEPVQDVVIQVRRETPRAPQEEITEGMWKLGERIIKIQIAHHGSGRPYGKELIITKPASRVLNQAAEHRWERLVGAVRILREQGGQKMTVEEAIEFGKLYGFCCRCGTILTDENSIEAGIGPVCAGKFV